MGSLSSIGSAWNTRSDSTQAGQGRKCFDPNSHSPPKSRNCGGKVEYPFVALSNRLIRAVGSGELSVTNGKLQSTRVLPRLSVSWANRERPRNTNWLARKDSIGSPCRRRRLIICPFGIPPLAITRIPYHWGR